MLKSNNALIALHRLFRVLVYTTLQLNPLTNDGRTQYECSSVPHKVPEKFSEAAKKLEASKNCRVERNDHVRMMNALENKESEDIYQRRYINHVGA